ncbi:golgin subfamily A member 6-like protein 7 [Cardiocondyla obscurior]|uniref:golgin subfamily A member 6-like protein 7 n=1 Tax=Cardiocondyla obscurior TaxID=286306 RepID=UPI0039658142
MNLVRAVRNKLKGDAHRSILGKTFNNMREFVEFLRSKYGPRESVYEAHGRLAYLCQKKDEKVVAYANRVRKLGKRILDVQKRETGEISEEFKKSVDEHFKSSFLRGLNKKIIINKERLFDLVEGCAIEAEKELETSNMIRLLVLAENTPTERKASARRVEAEVKMCNSVESFLKKLKLDHLYPAFADNKIDDLTLLPLLSEDEVKELIPLLSTRKKFQLGILSFKCNTSNSDIILDVLDPVPIKSIKVAEQGEKRKKRQEEKGEIEGLEGFRKSVKVYRSPVKATGEGGEEGISKEGFEEVIKEMRSGFARIQAQMEEVREIKIQIRKEIEELKIIWKKEKIDLEKRMDEMEKRIREKKYEGGIENKDEDFWKNMEKWEVIYMCETWLEEKKWKGLRSKLPKGYKWINKGAEKKNKKEGNGGMVMGWREELEGEEELEFKDRKGMIGIKIKSGKIEEKEGKKVIVFIDMKAAFDSVDRRKLVETMKKRGVREGLIRRCEEILEETVNKVKVKDKEGKSFWTTKGVRQGCPLSPSLFTLLLADIDEELEKEDEV